MNKKQCKNSSCKKKFFPRRSTDKYCSFGCFKKDNVQKPKKTTKNCKNPNCQKQFKPYNSIQKYCSLACMQKCENLESKPTKKVKRKRKRIPAQSAKRKVLVLKYYAQRKVFLGKPENKICFVEGCNKKADTVEHRKGRKGFADDYARENNIPLLLDERFWKPCCNAHNLEFERNPELSQKYQLSQIHDGKKLVKQKVIKSE